MGLQLRCLRGARARRRDGAPWTALAAVWCVTTLMVLAVRLEWGTAGGFVFVCYANEYSKVLRKPVGAAAAAPPFFGRPSRIRERFQVGQADLHPTPKTRVPRSLWSIVFTEFSSHLRAKAVCLPINFSAGSPCRSSNLGKICESATDTLAGTGSLLLLEGFRVPVQGNGIDHQHNEYCATLKHTALVFGSSGREG
jgi:hypothetical protein